MRNTSVTNIITLFRFLNRLYPYLVFLYDFGWGKLSGSPHRGKIQIPKYASTHTYTRTNTNKWTYILYDYITLLLKHNIGYKFWNVLVSIATVGKRLREIYLTFYNSIKLKTIYNTIENQTCRWVTYDCV